MSCCGGKCGCSSTSDCKCDKGCGGCKCYPDMSFAESTTTTETLVMGLAPQKQVYEDFEFVATENGYNCGRNYTRDPCK